MVEWEKYYREKKEEKKFLGIFSIFLVVAIVLGVLLALVFWMNNSIKEREEMTSRALFDLSMIARKISEENKTEEKIIEPERIYNCSRIETFRIYDLHDPFLMVAIKELNSPGVICQRAIYNKFPERVEITYYGNFYSSIRQRNVAVLEYKCFINNTLYNRQYAYIAQEDIGMFAEVIKLEGQIDYVSRVLLVMPERKDDYCLSD